MSKRTQKFFILFFMAQLFFGVGAWMYSSHFCKYDDGCDESTVDSCCSEVEAPVAAGFDGKDGSVLHADAPVSCCFDVNTYYNFPLYRTLKTELPLATSCMAFLNFCYIDLTGFDHSTLANLSNQDFGEAESPPSERHILFSIFRI